MYEDCTYLLDTGTSVACGWPEGARMAWRSLHVPDNARHEWYVPALMCDTKEAKAK